MANSTSIWVDADACPAVIRDMLYRASQRTKVPVTFVSNHGIKLPNSPYVKTLQVEKGFDIADNEIVKRVKSGDLVITSDIPLAADVIDKGCIALSSRGELFTKDNIKGRLNMRDFLETMRSSGVHTGGPPPLSQSDRQNFANKLDRYLAKVC
ncbi:YaiI/YqxD family protein [Agarilytica rhodophyticola]|uniref:YaiI/YqxD family protein n=1 Tax=Agarilytica rhodophyticola TaxID=1737490 RepID=UPI0024820D0C|nr:YaiI/YqxD family protein [Agarilytica rhodophyticola]